MMNIIFLTALFAFSLAFILGLALGFFKQFFAVAEDPLKEQIRELLPGANCGACGYPGCDGFAGALAAGSATPSDCPPGGKSTAEKLAALVGGNADVTPSLAVMACHGVIGRSVLRGEYTGVHNCRAAKISTGGIKACSWGCQGYGDCVVVCKFDAIHIGEEGIPVIDYKKCTGCRACSIECPQHIIRIIPAGTEGAVPLCSNLNVNKSMVLKNCKNGCIKCELCVKNCPEQCIRMANGVPAIDYSKCNDCGICTEKCPTKVLKLFKRDLLGV